MRLAVAVLVARVLQIAGLIACDYIFVDWF